MAEIDIIKELQHIGLSDKEARVYLAGIGICPATAQAIAKKAEVNRATTYVMIESLAERGLMSSFYQGKKRFFVAEPPDSIRKLIERERLHLEDKEKRFNMIFSDLQAIHATIAE